MDVPGFVLFEAMATWDLLLEHQLRQGICGPLLEIGVYYGKSAAMLAMHARSTEDLYLIDSTDFLNHAKETIAKAGAPNPVYLKVKSSDPAVWELSNTHNRRFRWIHIDGGHKGSTVANDLALVNELLSECGVICLDDFLNPMYPQLTHVVCNFVEAHRDELQMFLCGFNKAYVARPEQLRRYLTFVRNELGEGLLQLGVKDFTIFKTDYPGTVNCFGMGRQWQQLMYYGLDEAPNEIIY
jgi:predicted O-methyltransferase YrrM